MDFFVASTNVDGFEQCTLLSTCITCHFLSLSILFCHFLCYYVKGVSSNEYGELLKISDLQRKKVKEETNYLLESQWKGLSYFKLLLFD